MVHAAAGAVEATGDRLSASQLAAILATRCRSGLNAVMVLYEHQPGAVRGGQRWALPKMLAWSRVSTFGLPVSALLVALMLLSAPQVSASGNSITSPDTAGDVGRNTSLVLDSTDHPVVAYFDDTNDALKVLHCANANCTTGNTIASPDTTGFGASPSIALDAAGNPVVSYHDSTRGDLKVLHCGDPNCTAGNVSASPDTAGDVGLASSLALDIAGNPVVSYYDQTNFDLKMVHCGNPNCTAGNVVVSPDTAGAVGIDSSLVLDAIGNPVVSYSGVGLSVLHCGNPTCSMGNTIASVDSANPNVQDTSLALDATGNPVVGYYGSTFPNPGDLKLVHCGNATCTASNTIALPDSAAGDEGRNTSLALDGTGKPVVSYFNNTLNGELKLLHCGNVSCTSGNTITTPETHVGLDTSLALDVGGNPVVSYYDFTNDDLKVLHCGDPTCKAPPPAPTPTITATPTVIPPPVGGISLDPNASALPSAAPESSAGAWPLGEILAGVTAGLLGLGGAAWYTRRRRAQ